MRKVVCFGEVLWDVFPNRKNAGGAPMNVAFHLQKQGIKSVLISAVGVDKNGRELINYLQKGSLDTAYVKQIKELPTSTVDVILDNLGKATYTINQPVAWDAIPFDEELRTVTREADALVFGTLASRNAETRRTLLELLPAASFRVFDMNLRPPHFQVEHLKALLSSTDLLKVNDEELVYLTEIFGLEGDAEAVLGKLSKTYHIPSICVTLGENGAMMLHHSTFLRHRGFKVKVKDTVGSGDAHLATLIGGLLNGQPIEELLRRANAVGALVAAREGATADYTENEIQAICGT